MRRRVACVLSNYFNIFLCSVFFLLFVRLTRSLSFLFGWILFHLYGILEKNFLITFERYIVGWMKKRRRNWLITLLWIVLRWSWIACMAHAWRINIHSTSKLFADVLFFSFCFMHEAIGLIYSRFGCKTKLQCNSCNRIDGAHFTWIIMNKKRV